MTVYNLFNGNNVAVMKTWIKDMFTKTFDFFSVVVNLVLNGIQ